MQIKGVIFDKDGVIFNSEIFARNLMKNICSVLHLPFDNAFYNTLLGNNNRSVEKKCIDHFGSREAYELFNCEYNKAFRKGYQNHEVELKKGAFELINYLNDNNFPICMATSGSLESIELGFNNSIFAGSPFTYYMTGDEVTNSKPDPEIFLKAAEKINVDIRNCLVVEDSRSGLAAARRSGAIVCMVPDLIMPDETVIDCVDIIKKDLLEVRELLVPFVHSVSPSESDF